MSEADQINREIGELRGKLDGLATKEFVREVVQDQTTELNQKFDSKFDIIDTRLQEISERQQRFKGIGQALTFGLPFFVSALALAAVFLK